LLHLLHCCVGRPSKSIAPSGNSTKVIGGSGYGPTEGGAGTDRSGENGSRDSPPCRLLHPQIITTVDHPGHLARDHRVDDLPLASWPVAHQPYRSPRQLTHTSGTHSGKAAYRGSGTARAKPVHRPSGRVSTGQIRAADDDETDRDGASCRWLRAQDRLVVCVRWCVLKSVRGAQRDDESGVLPNRFIGQTLQVLAPESASIASLT